MGAEAAERSPGRGASGRGAKEMSTLLKASVSSAVATLADGVAYQLLLLALAGSYGFAAFAGALLGGVTNFTINRRWVFASTHKPLRNQATEYAFACLLTYGALQSCLFVFVEVLEMDEHLAWLPAKGIAWLLVSYPVHRFLVFSGGRTVISADQQESPPASEHPPVAA